MTRPPHAASSVVGYASDTASTVAKVEPNSNRSRETGRPYTVWDQKKVRIWAWGWHAGTGFIPICYTTSSPLTQFWPNYRLQFQWGESVTQRCQTKVDNFMCIRILTLPKDTWFARYWVTPIEFSWRKITTFVIWHQNDAYENLSPRHLLKLRWVKCRHEMTIPSFFT